MASSVLAADCGPLTNGYGPYDYRTQKKELQVVERFHFDRAIEQLQGRNNRALAGDINYTLRAFPNHTRALLSMDKLAQRMRTETPLEGSFTMECYYERAVRFRPDDGAAKVLFAHYLARKGKSKEAIQQLEEAEKILGQNANVHYNMGLAYLDMKDYDKALQHAHKAYQLGFPLPGLRKRLEKAGKWRDPDASQSAAVEQRKNPAAKQESAAAAELPPDNARGSAEPAAN
jgi:tetratricopeptide (TPR) repeat protein